LSQTRAAILGLATAALSAGAVVAVFVLVRWQILPGVPIVLGSFAALTGGGRLIVLGCTAFTDRRRYREEVDAHEKLIAEERKAWRDEKLRLADRPSDPEMAIWLDYDKDHVRLEAMRRWKLDNRDVVAHIVMSEGAEGTARARVPDGPTRYSRYIVRLFLLTYNGVRQLNVHLDFTTGAENKQTRSAFRYDAIAAAQIEEPNVWPHGRRQVATPEGGGPAGQLPRPVLRQALHLTLFDGTPVDIKAEYQDLLTNESRHDREVLFDLDRQTSGAVSALRTLESVAGEGREWLKRERERSLRTMSEFERTNRMASNNCKYSVIPCGAGE
jgi:hypothetical protein